MPEYKPADLSIPGPPRVHSGDFAQQYFTLSATHRAGFYQRVAVEAGRDYCFRLWGHSWSTDNPDDPWVSDGIIEQKVGIDPTGGTNWDGTDVIWGPMRQQHNEYGLFIACAIALSNNITVFTFSEPRWPVKRNDVYWDSAELFVVQETHQNYLPVSMSP